MVRTVDPYRELSVIDSRAPRTNQATIGALALVAFFTDSPWLIALLALQLIVGLTFGRRFCLPCVAYFELIQPRFGEGRIEDSRPPRFANMIGVVFLTASTILLFAGLATVGWVFALIVSALALLAAISGVCVGCELYVRIARLRSLRAEPVMVELESAGTNIVLFSSRYCLGCQEWADELTRSDVPFQQVNVGEKPEVAKQYGVTVTPMVLAINGDRHEVIAAYSEDAPKSAHVNALTQLSR